MTVWYGNMRDDWYSVTRMENDECILEHCRKSYCMWHVVSIEWIDVMYQSLLTYATTITTTP